LILLHLAGIQILHLAGIQILLPNSSKLEIDA